MHLNRFVVSPTVFLITLAGCDTPTPPPPEPPPPPVVIGAQYEPDTCGSVSGRVTWDGAVPAFDPISATVFSAGKFHQRSYTNPNIPDVDPATRAVRGAVVYLDGVEPARSKPWHHGPVRVEIRDDRLGILQGDGGPHRVGFVRRGDEVEMVSTDAAVHSLSVRGEAFMGLTFPDPDVPVRRRFHRQGLVDLSSGAGKFWHRAYLFVAEHSYFTRTDGEGRFTLDGVPPDEYELRCWYPNGALARTERDPNTGMVLRYVFAPPFEVRQRVYVGTGVSRAVSLRIPE